MAHGPSQEEPSYGDVSTLPHDDEGCSRLIYLIQVMSTSFSNSCEMRRRRRIARLHQARRSLLEIQQRADGTMGQLGLGPAVLYEAPDRVSQILTQLAVRTFFIWYLHYHHE